MKINFGDLALTASTFAHGEALPASLSVDAPADGGPDLVLSWTGQPEETRSYALVCTDPDAPLLGGFDHLVVYNVPGDVAELALADIDTHTVGRNSLGDRAWSPAAPPPGHGRHHYFFHLYALRSEPDLPEGLTHAELLARIDPDVLVQARVVGTYER